MYRPTHSGIAASGTVLATWVSSSYIALLSVIGNSHPIVGGTVAGFIGMVIFPRCCLCCFGGRKTFLNGYSLGLFANGLFSWMLQNLQGFNLPISLIASVVMVFLIVLLRIVIEEKIQIDLHNGDVSIAAPSVRREAFRSDNEPDKKFTEEANRKAKRQLVSALHGGDRRLVGGLVSLYGQQLISNLSPRYITSREAFELAIEYGFDVGKTDYHGWNVLHYAAYDGHTNLMIYLFDKHQNLIHTRTGGGGVFNGNENVLHCATRGGHARALRFLLDQDVYDVNDQAAHGTTALHWAMRKKFERCALLLIKNGASLDVQDAMDRTPLYVCIDLQFRARIHKLSASHSEIVIASGDDGSGCVIC